MLRMRGESKQIGMALASSPSPASLAQRSFDGSAAQTLARLLEAKRAQFLNFARKRVQSGADAEDLLQQALLKAAENIATLRQHERLEAWFYRVLRNVIADHRVQKARLESSLDAFAREALIASPADAAVCACSMGLLHRLPADYASILRSVDIEGLSIAEASTALRVSAVNAKVRLHRARKALRSSLQECCGITSFQACQTCVCDEHAAAP